MYKFWSSLTLSFVGSGLLLVNLNAFLEVWELFQQHFFDVCFLLDILLQRLNPFFSDLVLMQWYCWHFGVSPRLMLRNSSYEFRLHFRDRSLGGIVSRLLRLLTILLWTLRFSFLISQYLRLLSWLWTSQSIVSFWSTFANITRAENSFAYVLGVIIDQNQRMVFDGLFFFLQERAFDARVYLVQLLAGLSRHRPLLLGSTLLIVRI